jgi:ferrochelatase
MQPSVQSTKDPASPCSGVLFVTTGSPSEPTAEAVKDYLGRFLGDRRLVDLPRWKWMPILHCFILPKRSPKSAARYARIWTEEGSPLTVGDERLRSSLESELASRGHDVPVVTGSLYSSPTIEDALTELLDVRRAERLVVLTCYPQYASVTVGSMLQRVFQALQGRKRIPGVSVVDSYWDDSAYLDALASHIARTWRYVDDGHHKLVFSFHSTLCSDIEAGDAYQRQVEATCREVAKRLEIPERGWAQGYQCVFNTHTPWLGPLTQTELIPAFAEQGITDLAVVAPGFLSECLETYDDVDKDMRAEFSARVPDGRFTYVPCLDADPALVSALAGIVERKL